ncbi:NTP/NDP exchange transporter [Pontibacter chitinilyticus]|uniref:NTP/NDP exchange transporter n=1 Tax=Pontibacter chitinilyticus TaxID=2674989 RepID=UPI00321BE486
MRHRIYALLNIKPTEYKVVRQLFLVQFFLGIATAFLFTSTLTLFLHTFEAQYIPIVYLLSAVLLLLANQFYARLEHAYSPRRLLQVIILFSAISLLVTWAAVTFLPYRWLPFLLSAWNMVVYMLVGYAFWGMAAIIFNVRESKRIFSVVGSGDIPAKLMGYALVPLLAPLIGVTNLLWISILAFVGAYLFLQRFQHHAIDATLKSHQPHHQEDAATENPSILMRIFHNRLIFYIALFSLLAFSAYALIDYTLLVEIKSRFRNSPELAVFIGVFFAVGRILAIFFKLMFSSRVISQLGLSNALLLSPLVLLLTASALLLPGESSTTVLYTFGVMVLLSEVLKSAVQEPAFFVLFQPLEPHIRLKGHLLAKGYMLPFALLGSGLFLLLCDQLRGGISIPFIAQVLVGLLLLWIASIYLVKKEYLQTLVLAIRKGWFTGTELFLNDAPVRELLLQKLESKHPKDIILALELLERSGYKRLEGLLLDQLYSHFPLVRRYVLYRVIQKNMKDVLPLVTRQLQEQPQDELRPELLKVYYYFIPSVQATEQEALSKLNYSACKAACTGLLLRNDPAAHEVVQETLDRLVNSSDLQDKHLVLDILNEAPYRNFQPLLEHVLAISTEDLGKRAIETVGKVREITLVEQMVQKAMECKAWYALQKSLVLFGDGVFASEALAPEIVSAATLEAVVLAAGKVKGDYSTAYLLQLLARQQTAPDALLEALWLKQAVLHPADKQLVKNWLQDKLTGCRYKMEAFRTLQGTPSMQLLSDALASEVKQDLQLLLKGYALCYDRKRIDRVWKLLQLGNPERIANAIEILEHLIPKRYFRQTDQVLDFLLDMTERKLPVPALSEKEAPTVITSILQNEHMHCAAWTKSIACYLIPALSVPSLKQVLTAADQLPEDPVFQETKAHVLAVLS